MFSSHSQPFRSIGGTVVMMSYGQSFMALQRQWISPRQNVQGYPVIWNTIARKYVLQRLDNASRGRCSHARHLDEVATIVWNDQEGASIEFSEMGAYLGAISSCCMKGSLPGLPRLANHINYISICTPLTPSTCMARRGCHGHHFLSEAQGNN